LQESHAISVLVVPRSLEEFEPLLEHLSLNKPGPYDDNQPIVFPRGTIMSGGRLDLCKQVVGPQGVQPLLNAMKHSSYVSRLLLGNCLKFNFVEKQKQTIFVLFFRK
jgi:hypothetical protein